MIKSLFKKLMVCLDNFSALFGVPCVESGSKTLVQTNIQEAIVSNLGRDNGEPEVSRGFCFDSPSIWRDSTLARQRPLSSKSIASHHSSIVPPFYVI
jgi:hypothetical protein